MSLDALATLPTSASKTATPTIFVLILVRVNLNPEGFMASYYGRFPDNPALMIVVHVQG